MYHIWYVLQTLAFIHPVIRLRICRAAEATPFPLDPAGKTLYHGATVMACNNLVALLEAALQLYEQAGVPRPTALEIIAPIVRGTVDNVLRMGTTEAPTGPVARGYPRPSPARSRPWKPRSNPNSTVTWAGSTWPWRNKKS